MPEPTIVYGTMEQPMHTNAQYLLMQAGIANGTYPTQEFIEAINGVSLDGITKDECRRDVENQRQFLQTFAQMGETVTVQNYQPDKARLEAFVSTTFREMHNQLNRRG